MKRRSLYLTMRDGVKIAVDLCLPDHVPTGARLPTILHQTRYWRAVDFRWPVGLLRGANGYDDVGVRPAFLRHGYAWVSVDVRGSGASYGYQTGPYPPESVGDVWEIADWIVQQPWSNGKIGTYGISYDGFTAVSALRARHPALAACAPTYTVFDLYPDIAGIGGVPFTWFHRTWGQGTKALDANRLGLITGWLPRLVVKGVRPVYEDRRRVLLAEAIRTHAGNWDVYETSFRISCRDDRLPYDPDWCFDTFSPHYHLADIQASGAPIYAYSGWLDGGFCHAAIRYFLNVRTPGTRLTIGPWDHGGMHNISPTVQRKVPFSEHTAELLRFVDAHLKGEEAGIAAEEPVRYYTMVEDRWKRSAEWPPPGTRRLPCYLAPGNALAIGEPVFEDGEACDTYRVDYSAGTGDLTRWKTLVGRAPSAHLYGDRAERDRKLLVYTSPPLAEDTEVTGHPFVTLYVASTAKDGNFFVYLEDVDERGNVTYVTEGLLRALHRRVSSEPPPYRDVVPYRSYSRADAAPLVPGEITELAFDLLPTSYLFRAGHAIRVALAGADRDHFFVPPGEPPVLRFYRDADHPSRVDLPVVPRR